LLFAGVILHDLGKVKELSGAITPHYTAEGNLLGHISIGHTMIKEKADQLGYHGEEVVLLEHLVLAHHGKNEFGSPVLPQVKEAEILYLVDNIDARMAMFDKAYEGLAPGETSKRIFALENRTLYRPESQ
jgi:3'-5' exoribonuclease